MVFGSPGCSPVIKGYQSSNPIETFKKYRKNCIVCIWDIELLSNIQTPFIYGLQIWTIGDLVQPKSIEEDTNMRLI